jgi:nucleotide-binding universal stress UspA family protein
MQDDTRCPKRPPRLPLSGRSAPGLKCALTCIWTLRQYNKNLLEGVFTHAAMQVRERKHGALSDPRRYRTALDRQKMYRKVVVPLDGSELAQGVLPHVAEVIRDRGSQVYLLSVAPPVKGVAPGAVDVRPSPASMQNERQRIKREWREYLQAVARQLEPDAASVQVGVCFGRPAEEILTFADTVGADLIAMSAQGRFGIGRWVFGNVVDRVLRGATCPVLLVQARQVQRRIAYERILVPLDGSELAEQVLPYVKGLIRPQRTRVFLVRVLTAGLGDRAVALLRSYPPGLQLATTTLHHAKVQLQGYLRSVATALREQGAVVHTAVRRGSPADEILAYAAEVEADLVSITTHGLSGMSRWVYGNVAGRVLQGADCPVLLVRPTSE